MSDDILEAGGCYASIGEKKVAVPCEIYSRIVGYY